jgi:hypothetical protein
MLGGKLDSSSGNHLNIDDFILVGKCILSLILVLYEIPASLLHQQTSAVICKLRISMHQSTTSKCIDDVQSVVLYSSELTKLHLRRGVGIQQTSYCSKAEPSLLS